MQVVRFHPGVRKRYRLRSGVGWDTSGHDLSRTACGPARRFLTWTFEAQPSRVRTTSVAARVSAAMRGSLTVELRPHKPYGTGSTPVPATRTHRLQGHPDVFDGRSARGLATRLLTAWSARAVVRIHDFPLCQASSGPWERRKTPRQHVGARL